MARIPHFLDIGLTDGVRFVRPMHRPPLYSPETMFLFVWYSFVLPGLLEEFIKIIHLLTSRTRDLPACTIVS
jgi:hypothetical protein